MDWSTRLRLKLEADTRRIILGQSIARALVRQRMGKLHEVAQSVARLRQTLHDQADSLQARVDSISQRAPDAFERAHAVLNQHTTDLDQMDAELRQLSNLGPLDSEP